MSLYDVCAAVSFALMFGGVLLVVVASAVGGVLNWLDARRERARDIEEYGS